jgi:hypothetical protein
LIRPFAVSPIINFLIFTLTRCKRISSRITEANSGSVVAWNGIVPVTTQDTVIPARAIRSKSLTCLQARPTNTGVAFVIFGSLAVLANFVTVDPWLCVAGFRRVCLYRMFSYVTMLAQNEELSPYNGLSTFFEALLNNCRKKMNQGTGWIESVM